MKLEWKLVVEIAISSVGADASDSVVWRHARCDDGNQWRHTRRKKEAVRTDHRVLAGVVDHHKESLKWKSNSTVLIALFLRHMVTSHKHEEGLKYTLPTSKFSFKATHSYHTKMKFFMNILNFFFFWKNVFFENHLEPIKIFTSMKRHFGEKKFTSPNPKNLIYLYKGKSNLFLPQGTSNLFDSSFKTRSNFYYYFAI